MEGTEDKVAFASPLQKATNCVACFMEPWSCHNSSPAETQTAPCVPCSELTGPSTHPSHLNAGTGASFPQVSPKSNDRCPHKKRTEMGEEGDAKVEAEVGGMRPPAKDHLEPPEAKRNQGGSSPEPSEEGWACPHFGFRCLDTATVGE